VPPLDLSQGGMVAPAGRRCLTVWRPGGSQGFRVEERCADSDTRSRRQPRPSGRGFKSSDFSVDGANCRGIMSRFAASPAATLPLSSGSTLPWAELERLIRRDPGRRGLIEAEETREPLCPGHLAAAADHLARFGRSVWIVTGFFIPAGQPPAAETDGPPGAALLAKVLSDCGLRVELLTDRPCASAVAVAAEQYALPHDCVGVCPLRPPDANEWLDRRVRMAAAEGLTHLIAVERVGPSHSLSSFAGSRSLHDPAVQAFCREVPAEHWDRCHNMRGEIIDDHTGPLHGLFLRIAAELPHVRTIGIGDGGNEIGMGSIPWDELRSRLAGPAAPLVPCRIPTDWTILAGVSNWGAQALAAGVCRLRGTADGCTPYDTDAEQRRMLAVVQRGPAVDGVTRLQQPTVDGLPFLTYIQPWEAMRRWLANPGAG
jgi:hypothetical protein